MIMNITTLVSSTLPLLFLPPLLLLQMVMMIFMTTMTPTNHPTNFKSTFNQLSTNIQSAFNQLSINFQPTFNQLSTNFQSTFNQHSTSFQPLSKNRFDANCVLLVNTIVVPITFIILPFSRNIWSLTAILAVMGINMGFIDCIANLQMFKVFGDSVAPFLHVSWC